ncbi:hypothetical protein Ahy_B03g064801 [Arachis hypogaea]|uniref:Uncharacterized protein n=1 Tax=Arachis hypogaea TaxID=3818 RepID=A0A445A0G4_ARAHY|nr:hypothetical protein Ahy_B03g064801 [Arachis hypogaea]
MNNPKSPTPILTQSPQFHNTDACILRVSLLRRVLLYSTVFFCSVMFFCSCCVTLLALLRRVVLLALSPTLFRRVLLLALSSSLLRRIFLLAPRFALLRYVLLLAPCSSFSRAEFCSTPPCSKLGEVATYAKIVRNVTLFIFSLMFQEFHERKVELQQAIIKMEQGGSADGNLQIVDIGKTLLLFMEHQTLGDKIREKKKEETRTHNAQLHATISVVAVASVVAAIAAAMAASYTPSKDERMAKIDMAIASAATFVAMQCVEAAEAMGDERDHLASVVSSAVNVSSHDDTTTLTATAATTTALRGAATLKSRALKEVRNIAAVTLLRKAEEGLKFVAKLLQIVKYQQQYQRKDDVLHICTDLPAWLGRHLLDDGEKRKYFGLKTNARGIVEIEYIWTQGVSGFFPLLHKDKIDLETDPCILQNYLITIN